MRLTPCMMIGLVGVAVLLLLSAPASAADPPEIAVEASATEIYIGESVDYVVEIRNAENPTAPDLTAVRRDFDVVSTGDESHNQSSTFIINGRVTQQNSFGHAYRFRLTPRRKGHLVIPAPTATIDGKTVSGRAWCSTSLLPKLKIWSFPRSKRIATGCIPHSRSR